MKNTHTQIHTQTNTQHTHTQNTHTQITLKHIHINKNKHTPEVNFINVRGATFTRADPESAKKTDVLTVFFVLLGSIRVKAAALRTYIGKIYTWST